MRKKSGRWKIGEKKKKKRPPPAWRLCLTDNDYCIIRDRLQQNMTKHSVHTRVQLWFPYQLFFLRRFIKSKLSSVFRVQDVQGAVSYHHSGPRESHCLGWNLLIQSMYCKQTCLWSKTNKRASLLRMQCTGGVIADQKSWQEGILKGCLHTNTGLNHRLLQRKVGSLNQVREDKKVSFESFALQAYFFLFVRVN